MICILIQLVSANSYIYFVLIFNVIYWMLCIHIYKKKKYIYILNINNKGQNEGLFK